MRSIVVSGGKAPSKELLLNNIKDKDFIIGVDKGCNVLYKYNIKPNLILGDFDSIDKNVLDYFCKSRTNILSFPPEKDYTDTDLAYEKAKENGSSEILFFGVTGSRLDHSLGNIGILLKSLREGIKSEIIDDNNRIFLIDKKTTLKGNFGDTISFHAISDVVEDVNITGGKYPLDSYDMTLFEPRAICNEFIHKDITINFKSGIIMVIYPKE